MLRIALSACICTSLGLTLSHAQQSAQFTSLKEIRERGVVMQKWETSCAAATLATVLTYGFKDGVTERYVAARMLEKSTAATIKKQGGFSLLDMKHFVEERGYIGLGYRDLSLSDLKAFHAPIVPIVNYGFNHYVVINGIQDDEVLLADPAFGNRKMHVDQFNEVWVQGIAFVVTATEKNDKNRY